MKVSVLLLKFIPFGNSRIDFLICLKKDKPNGSVMLTLKIQLQPIAI